MANTSTTILCITDNQKSDRRLTQNTYNSSETLRLLLKESRESQKRSNSQFVITTLITLATLFLAALPYIERIKSFFRLIHF